MSVSFSMMVTSTPRASSDWQAIWPKRPKPITSTLPVTSSPAAAAAMMLWMPRMSCGGLAGSSQRSDSMASGVRAIDRMTAAVSSALTCAAMMPLAAAAAYSTKANSPPWAISRARSSASGWRARATRAIV